MKKKGLIDRPIIIIGTGRCGSTEFHRIFSYHPNVAWLSSPINHLKETPTLYKLFMRAIDIPIFGRLLRRFKPGECYPFFEYHCKGFSRPFRDLIEKDVTTKSKLNLRNVLSRIITGKRHRLLLKITGWSRVRFLNEIFPDAKFVHILRDGRAVANSLINVDFWRGWEGPENWRWGPLPDEIQQKWNELDKSFLALAAFQWELLTNSVAISKKHIGRNRILEIRYEEFCSSPAKVFEKVLQFCELSCSEDFLNLVQNQSIRNMNFKWTKELTNSQKKMLNRILHERLQEYGYPVY